LKALRLLGLCAALGLAPLAMAQSAPTPLGKFLQAADINDFAGMAAAMAPTVQTDAGGTMTSAEFIRKVSNCYLRRIYRNQGLLAGWMCDEGQGKSRVVFAALADAGDRVKLTAARELRNDQPAPPRAGSAFAERKS